MAELKTKATRKSVEAFLKSLTPEAKRMDSLELLEIFKKATGEQPVMWGKSIVGFGSYHYKSERSSQEGSWPLVGFSPRKDNFSLYVLYGNRDEYENLLEKLGKHKTSVACLYIKKLSDIDSQVLARLVKERFRYNKKTLAGQKNKSGN